MFRRWLPTIKAHRTLLVGKTLGLVRPRLVLMSILGADRSPKVRGEASGSKRYLGTSYLR